MHRTAFKPSVAVTAEHDGSAGGVVKMIVLADRATRRTEKCASGAVVANDVAPKCHGGRSTEVFNSPKSSVLQILRQFFVNRDEHLFHALERRTFDGTNRLNDAASRMFFHRAGLHEQNGVARRSPIKTVGLSMLITTTHGVLVNHLFDAEVDAVNIDGVIHGVFIESSFRLDVPAALREMCGVSLRCEVARVTGAAECHVKASQGDVVTALGNESHAFCIVYGHFLQNRGSVVRHEDAGTGAPITSHRHNGARDKSFVLPVRCEEVVSAKVNEVARVNPEISGVEDDVASVFFKGYARLGLHYPVFAVGFQCSVAPFAPLHPWCHLKGDALFGVLQHLNLGDLRIVGIHTNSFERAVFPISQDDGQHASVTANFCSLSIHNEVLPSVQHDAYRFRLVLVMVGNEERLFAAVGGVKVIDAFLKFQFQRFARFLFAAQNTEHAVQA